MPRLSGYIDSKSAKCVNILALDPGTKTGWAHSCGQSGVFDLSVRRDESSGMRLVRLRGKLNEIKRDVGVSLLVYEAARFAGKNGRGALVIQSMFQGVIVEWCVDNNVDYRGYSSTEIKKYATGNGNASKELMIAVAEKVWPQKKGMDDNEADALLLLSMTQSTLIV